MIGIVSATIFLFIYNTVQPTNEKRLELQPTLCKCASIVAHKCSKKFRCENTLLPVVDIPVALHDKSILLLGDSIPWQLSMTMKCVAGSKVHTKSVGMHIFPLNEIQFENTLQKVVQQNNYSAIIFGIGTWYNWEWGTQYDDENLDTMMKRCPESFQKDIKNMDYNAETNSYDYAQKFRSGCKLLLRKNSFRLGLERLVRIVHRHKDDWPPIFWKNIPPQHFPTPSGQYDWGGIGNENCIAIANKSLAFDRNKVAYGILKSSGLINHIDTWDEDIDEWKSHPGSDCTHYCNPSKVTLSRVDNVFKQIVKTQMKNDHQFDLIFMIMNLIERIRLEYFQ